MSVPKESTPKDELVRAENGSGEEAREVPENRLGDGENGNGEAGLLPCGPVIWIVGTVRDIDSSVIATSLCMSLNENDRCSPGLPKLVSRRSSGRLIGPSSKTFQLLGKGSL